MEEGLKFTPQEISLALAMCSRECQLEVKNQLLLDRIDALAEENMKLQETVDRLAGG